MTETGAWPAVELDALVNSERPICYGVLKPGRYERGGVPLVRILDLEGNVISEDSLFRITPRLDKEFKRSRLGGGELLISIQGTVGRVARVPGTLAGANISRTLARVALGEDADPTFLRQWFLSSAGQRALFDPIVGTTRASLNLGSLRTVLVPSPPIAEQRRVGEILETLDAQISVTARIIAKLKVLRRGLTLELGEGSGSKGSESRLLPVREVLIQHASGPSPTCDERQVANDEEWGLLKTTAVTWDGWNEAAHKVPPRVFWGNKKLEVHAGDVLITKAGPLHRVGVVAYVPQTRARLMVSGKMVGLRPNPKVVLPEVLAIALATRAAQAFLRARTSGMADSQVNFANQALLDTPLCVPSIEVQRQIADVVRTFDVRLVSERARLSKLRRIKSGLVSDLMTRRVRTIAGIEASS